MLPTLRGWLFLGARERSFRFTRRNWALETMAGNAFSTRTGSALFLASTPQTKVLDFVKSVGPKLTVGRTIFELWLTL